MDLPPLKSMVAILSGILLATPPFSNATDVSYVYQGQYVNQKDAQIGYAALPNSKAQVEKKWGTEPIYKVQYQFDQFGRRTWERENSPNKKKFAAFFGGSNTFGEGLPVKESIPYLVEKNAEDFSSYNYGFQGYGLNNVLMQLKTHNLQDELPEQEGYGFYLYHYFHRHRLIGTARYFSWSHGRSPSLVNKEGQLINQGLFVSARPFYYYSLRLLELSGFLDWFNIDYPNILSPKANALLCKTLVETQSLFTKSLKKGHFVVVVDFNTPDEDDIVNQCLIPQKIKHIDLRPDRPIEHSEYKIKSGVDDHNNLKANQLIAGKIVKWIQRQEL